MGQEMRGDLRMRCGVDRARWGGSLDRGTLLSLFFLFLDVIGAFLFFDGDDRVDDYEEGNV